MIARSRLTGVIILNITIIAAEITFGLFSHSMALIADAFHNLSDVFSLIIAYIAMVYASKKANRRMTYGYIRSEMMAGFLNSLFLILTMGFVIFESVKRVINPEPVNGYAMMAVAAIALVANAFSAFILKDFRHSAENVCRDEADHHHHHEDEHHDHENMNLRAAYLHLLGDAGISLGVVVGGAVVAFTGFQLIDPLFSIGFSVYILVESFKVWRITFASLMDASAKNRDQIENTILKHPEVISLHDIHITRPASREIYFSAHVVLNGSLSLDQVEGLFETLRQELSHFGITHSLFQPESPRYHDQGRTCQSHD